MSPAGPDRLERRAPARRPLPNFVGFVLTIAMVWLGGQFVTQGLSDYFQAPDPELAVLWRGDSADAVAALARKRLVGHDRDGALRLAGRALQLAPLNASALTTYGFALDQLGRQPQADAAMFVAGRLGWRDLVTQIWLLRRMLLAGDVEAALNHADALMRRQDVVPAPVLAALAAAARDPRTTDALVRHLAQNPAWRTPFIVYLSAFAQPPATDVAHALLTRLARGPTPPTDDELAVFLRNLVGARRFGDAAQAWRELTHGAGQTGYVYDGDFERAPGQTPFDWALGNGVGWTAMIAPAPAGGHGQGLWVQYDGVSPTQSVRQLLVLPPGAYRLSGQTYGEGDADPRALSWSVDCATTGQVLGGAPTPVAKEQWRAFAVAARACRTPAVPRSGWCFRRRRGTSTPTSPRGTTTSPSVRRSPRRPLGAATESRPSSALLVRGDSFRYPRYPRRVRPSLRVQLMRKYLVATAIGAMLIAGQAAATDSAVVNLGDRLGSQSDTANNLDGSGGAFLVLGAVLAGGLLIWGLSEAGHGRAVGPQGLPPRASRDEQIQDRAAPAGRSFRIRPRLLCGSAGRVGDQWLA